MSSAGRGRGGGELGLETGLGEGRVRSGSGLEKPSGSGEVDYGSQYVSVCGCIAVIVWLRVCV